MPILSNTRHERFAQALATGLSQADAYVEAGYKASRSAAARLAADVNICERVAEIAERVAVRTEVTAAEITGRLLAIAKKAEGKDEAAMLQVARASLMDAAKLNGLVVDKSEANLNADVSLRPSRVEFVAPHADDDGED